MEDAIANHYTGNLIEDAGSANKETSEEPSTYLKHESVGKEILKRDSELLEILTRYNIDPEKIYSIFTRETDLRFTNLISSDLDADRIDYLLRTAHHAGLPYGSIDLDYLLSQMRLDNNNRICLTVKALRTVDHFLLSRYFDYQQVPFHKTVAAFELVLEDVLEQLLEEGFVNGSAKEIVEVIEKGAWYEFDDICIIHKIRQFSSETTNDVHKEKARAILNRIPPKLLASADRLGRRDTETANTYRGQKQQVKAKLSEWASKFGIDKKYWYVWQPKGTTLTKIGSHIPSSDLIQDPSKEVENLVQTAHILNENTGESSPLSSHTRSLMSILANYEMYPLRVYALLPPGMENKASEIRETIVSDLPYIDWT